MTNYSDFVNDFYIQIDKFIDLKNLNICVGTSYFIDNKNIYIKFNYYEVYIKIYHITIFLMGKLFIKGIIYIF